MAHPRPTIRLIQLGTGVLLILGAGVAGPLPGPGGVFLFAGGMILILRNSARSRWAWARLKRRFPRMGGLVDRVMRRQSAIRRRERDRALPPEVSPH